VSDPAGQQVPEYGFTQAEREVASARSRLPAAEPA
jgi:hypothetical protein